MQLPPQALQGGATPLRFEVRTGGALLATIDSSFLGPAASKSARSAKPGEVIMRLHWGVGIAATYLVFAGATAGFVTFAMRSASTWCDPTTTLTHSPSMRSGGRRPEPPRSAAASTSTSTLADAPSP